MAHPLDGVQAKLARAAEHLDALDREVDAFLKSEPYDVVLSGDWGEQVGRFHIVREPPLQLGIIAGDFSHNLRSALDHLVYQVAKLTTPSPQGTMFPIALTEADYWEPRGGRPSMRDRYLGDVDPGFRSVFDEMQPYRRGTLEQAKRHPAAILNRFANTDKHRVIHTAYGQLRGARAWTSGGSMEIHLTIPDPLPVLREGIEVYKISIDNPSHANVQMHTSIQFTMVYGRDRLDDGDFRNLHADLGAILEGFRLLFD